MGFGGWRECVAALGSRFPVFDDAANGDGEIPR